MYTDARLQDSGQLLPFPLVCTPILGNIPSSRQGHVGAFPSYHAEEAFICTKLDSGQIGA